MKETFKNMSGKGKLRTSGLLPISSNVGTRDLDGNYQVASSKLAKCIFSQNR